MEGGSWERGGGEGERGRRERGMRKGGLLSEKDRCQYRDLTWP